MLAAALAFAAVVTMLPAGSTRRLSQLLGDRTASSVGVDMHASSIVERAVPRAVVCVLAAVGVGWVVSGPAIALAGVPLGLVLARWIGRLESPTAAAAREEIARDLPLAADLLSACAQVGRPVEQSLDVVSRAVGGALSQRLDGLSARLALGADPASEWRRLALDEQLAPLGRTMLRAVESGAPLVDGLTRLAQDSRRDRRTHMQLRARSVGVKAAGPLAACFLPAFMLIGVVPTVVGAFQHLVL